MRSNPWFLRPVPRRSASQKLICFHHAGGNASLYYQWPASLPDSIELISVQLPGRGNRIAEPCHVDMPELIEELYETVKPELDKPFAFFGYSMGGLVAYELARRFEKEGIVAKRVFAAAIRAPQVFHQTGRPKCSELADEALMAELRKLGGTPEEMFANRELWDLCSPIIRADYEVLDHYQHAPMPQLRSPLTVFGGDNDAEATPEALGAWKAVCSDDFRLRMYTGGHFFINSHLPSILRAVLYDLQSNEIVHPTPLRVWAHSR